MAPVPLITRAISVTSDAAILGITLWKTFHIFKVDKDAQAATSITTKIAYNGMILRSLVWNY